MAETTPASDRGSQYDEKRRFDSTPEPPGDHEGDVDPATAEPGERFVIQQHHATRLHHDVRLEMLNGETPVLVSWAVPKRLPLRDGERHLAIRTEDHPIEYATFSGSIPEGNYGAGEVRIFDSGTYRIVDRRPGRLTVELSGRRLQGRWHLVQTRPDRGKDQWLAILSEDGRPPPDPLPDLDPMLATLGAEPFDDPAWAFEPKWDGIRALAVCDGSTRFISRNRRDVTAGYPELARLHEQVVALDAVVDGEIVAFEAGVPSFQRLQSRMHVRDPRQVERLAASVPVIFMAFDVIAMDGRDLTGLAYSDRREILEAALVPADFTQVSPAIAEHGAALFSTAAERGLEGVVAKRLASHYLPGARSSSWVKIKTTADVDAVVVGWLEGEGRRSGTLGSLVLGLYGPDGGLRYVGNVGTGFDGRTLGEVLDRLTGLGDATSPFEPAVLREKSELRRAHWVPPELVARVEYRQVTSAGRLRAPSFQGLRDDKRPEDCTTEQLTAT